MLKKKFILVLIIIIFSIYVVGAIVDYFGFKSVRTSYSKKVIFEFDFSASFDAATIGPGESVYINPYITNNSTELMYVFIRDVNIIYEDTRKKKLSFFARLKKRIGRWLLK